MAADVTLRPAASADVESISRIWHQGWLDGHVGHVPETLLQHRQLADFRWRTEGMIDRTTVAIVGSKVAGFVAVRHDQLEQLYVDRTVRGAGVAVTLLRRAEHDIAAGYPAAWLAVAEGNLRARRFYAREGWGDAGTMEYVAEIRGGTIPTTCLRYEKLLIANAR